MGKHHFCIEIQVKDTGIKDMLRKIYCEDFTEAVQPKTFYELLNLSDELSWENQKLLKMMEKRSDKGRWTLPLHSKIEIYIG